MLKQDNKINALWNHVFTLVSLELFRAEAEFATQPPMMTFKQFLGSQDDNISDEEAMKRYNDYKTDFRKQQIKEFFLQHKDEDWYGLAI